MGRKREGYAGRGERIRTSDSCVPNAVLYQAELHPEMEDGSLTEAVDRPERSHFFPANSVFAAFLELSGEKKQSF
jgi:hypothetical protein